ncbi:deoxyribose-phosphate aldolase [Cetobacterium sp. 2A]|uniref:deoxyribose-phosphate aldolase n=1 Tax=unclassified Cetobacterium TaxID=2630983 RepID=UPI00163D325B|nr:deoxyribose-phosphate aldolase [Cetobacterium sp. 2A]MBC2855499.1 deoxyribose-phosphate aldolase [Cetobacterium sp. 2A]
MKLNKYIDHTVLKATTEPKDIIKLCAEAREYDFYAVCVNGCYVKLSKQELEGTNVKVCAVIGFPLGAMDTESKIFEAKQCIKNGASEIDMVINVGMLKAGEFQYVEDEIRGIKEAIGENTLKVIIENCYLTDAEKRKATELCLNAKADFVKTSTGFGTGGATFEDIALMKSIVGDMAQLKAAGGVRDLETAMKYIELGVTRLGTSSGVELVTIGTADPNKY